MIINPLKCYIMFLSPLNNASFIIRLIPSVRYFLKKYLAYNQTNRSSYPIMNSMSAACFQWTAPASCCLLSLDSYGSFQSVQVIRELQYSNLRQLGLKHTHRMCSITSRLLCILSLSKYLHILSYFTLSLQFYTYCQPFLMTHLQSI